MADQLLNELNRNLKSAEEVGDKEWAKRLKARIAKLEKTPEPEPVPEPEPPAVVVGPEAPAEPQADVVDVLRSNLAVAKKPASKKN